MLGWGLPMLVLAETSSALYSTLRDILGTGPGLSQKTGVTLDCQ